MDPKVERKETFTFSETNAKVQVEKKVPEVPHKPIFMIIKRDINTKLKTLDNGTSLKTVTSNEITTLVMDVQGVDVENPDDWLIKVKRVHVETSSIDKEGKVTETNIKKNEFV